MGNLRVAWSEPLGVTASGGSSRFRETSESIRHTARGARDIPRKFPRRLETMSGSPARPLSLPRGRMWTLAPATPTLRSADGPPVSIVRGFPPHWQTQATGRAVGTRSEHSRAIRGAWRRGAFLERSAA